MSCNGVVMCLTFFDVIYEKRKLYVYKYLDSTGQKKPLGGIVYAQVSEYIFYE